MRVKSPVFNRRLGIFFEPFSRREPNVVQGHQQKFLDPFDGGRRFL